MTYPSHHLSTSLQEASNSLPPPSTKTINYILVLSKMVLQSSTGSRFTAKGPQRRRVKAPELDTSALIRDNALTLIGRIANPTEQRVALLLSALPRNWTLKGKVFGSDLGMDCFQFLFEIEEGLQRVLANQPYQFCNWMVVIQRWEPIISPTFPSQIPFWIRLHGLPLHYWHEKALYNIGLDLGSLEDYSITKSSVKIRLILDVFKPIEKEIIFDFSSGEELVLQLEYENLGRHCSECNSLLHESTRYPERVTTPVISTSRNPQGGLGLPKERLPPPPAERQTSEYSQRVDRHGRPFGERLPLINRGAPLRNKLTPRHDMAPPARRSDSAPRRNQLSRSPTHSTSRRRHGPSLNDKRSSPPPSKAGQQQWREKTKETANLSVPQQRDPSPPLRPKAPPTLRPPLERNLALLDFPQLPTLPPIPSREEVLNELHEVTLQYTSCADPTESAARRQRVLQSDMEGLMERTATSIIDGATAKHNVTLLGSSSRGDDLNLESMVIPTVIPSESILILPPAGAKPTKKRGRPAKKVAASPKVFVGAGSSRISHTHKLPQQDQEHVDLHLEYNETQHLYHPLMRLTELLTPLHSLWCNLRIFRWRKITSLRNIELELFWAWESKNSPKAHGPQ